jgi:acetyl esterase/lipase
MPLDPHVQRFLGMMAVGSPAMPGVTTRRQGQRMIAQLAGTDSVAVGRRSLSLALRSGPRPARLYIPNEDAPPGPGLVFFHGGGLVAGDLETHDALCARIADASGCRVVAATYRLAPEHPYPAAIEDAVCAVRCVASLAGTLGIDAGRLAIAGESAGAGLAARVCQELRGSDIALAAQLLLCPVLDLRFNSPSYQEFASGYLLDAATVRHDVEALGVAESATSPRVSPLLEPDLSGLPPAQIHTAAYDMFRDDGAAYARRLEQAGVPVSLTCHEGMIHFFYGLGRMVPAARPSLSSIGSQFGALLRHADRETASIARPRRPRRVA